MTKKTNLALCVFFVLLSATMRAQGTGPVVPGQPTEQADNKTWSFAAAGYGYIVPDDQSYFSPTFRADRGWAHLEARYNYEDRKTGSLWLGYNMSIGKKLVLDATPMVGGIFGNTTGVAPGYLFTLSYKKISLYSEGEFVFDTKNSGGNFFYNWNELSYSPTDWVRLAWPRKEPAHIKPLLMCREAFSQASHTSVWISPCMSSMLGGRIRQSFWPWASNSEIPFSVQVKRARIISQLLGGRRMF